MFNFALDSPDTYLRASVCLLPLFAHKLIEKLEQFHWEYHCLDLWLVFSSGATPHISSLNASSLASVLAGACRVVQWTVVFPFCSQQVTISFNKVFFGAQMTHNYSKLLLSIKQSPGQYGTLVHLSLVGEVWEILTTGPRIVKRCIVVEQYFSLVILNFYQVLKYLSLDSEL